MNPKTLWFVFLVYDNNEGLESYAVGRYGEFAGCSDVVFCSNDKRLAQRMALHFQLSGGKI